MNEGESAENGGIAAEATDRKLRSESILRAEGVPFIAWLPAIETADEALKRSKEEVALRTLCLSLVAAKAEGLEQDAVERVLESYGLRPHGSGTKHLSDDCSVYACFNTTLSLCFVSRRTRRYHIVFPSR
jgi:hypothetical protein